MRPFVTLSAFVLPFALFTFACSGDPNGSPESSVEEEVVDAGTPDADPSAMTEESEGDEHGDSLVTPPSQTGLGAGALGPKVKAIDVVGSVSSNRGAIPTKSTTGDSPVVSVVTNQPAEGQGPEER